MNASEHRYSEDELARMAERLDRVIELSALCMDLVLAGRLQRISGSVQAPSTTADSAAPAAVDLSPEGFE